MGRLYKEWRRARDEAGILLGYVAKAIRAGRREEAWRVYEEWRAGKLDFDEAKNLLEKLVAEARAAAPGA